MNKLDALTTLYNFVHDQTSSFEEDNVGADLAYLTCAILNDHHCSWPSDRTIVGILKFGKEQPSIAFALEHIRVEDEDEGETCATCVGTGRNATGDDICTDCFLPEGSTSKHPERCDCHKCRPELYV
jgi:hypothetical protein